MSQAAEAVVIVSDLHINSTVALCPPGVELDDGGTFRQSPEQRWIWRSWLDFWEKVKTLDCSARYVVLNGDVFEGDHHNTTQIVSRNPSTQFDMAIQVLEPVAKIADHLFVVRGTAAHSGPAAYWEERIAKDLSATRAKAGKEPASWWHLPMKAGGVLFDIGHHPQTGGNLPHTRDPAASRQAGITWQEYHEMGQKPPDVVVRAHRHYYAVGYNRGVMGVNCPSWQLTTTFGRRLGTGRRIEPIGGLVFLCSNGHYTWWDQRYRPRPARLWTPPSSS